MPQAMTFASLQTDVRSYLERGASAVTDPLVYAQIPSLINFAERRISRDLKIQGFQVAVVTTLQANVAVLAKPDRWRDTISPGSPPSASGDLNLLPCDILVSLISFFFLELT